MNFFNQFLEQRLTMMRQIQIDQRYLPSQLLKKQHMNTNAQLLDAKCLKKAGELATQVFKQKVTILEVGAGDGESTKAFLSTFGQLKQYIGTDLHYGGQNPKIMEGISSRQAIKKFGSKCDCLLIIHPPPNCSMDYAAIRDFEKLQNSKYLIYIGEMGATDGCPGIYKYLMESTKWKLTVRKLLRKFETFICMENEIFVFERIK